MQSTANEEYEQIVDQLGGGPPGLEDYQRMSALILTFPEADELARLDPFSAEYKQAAMDLYLKLRDSGESDYVVARDEPPALPVPGNMWTELVPWSFQDAKMVAEHLYAWGHALQHVHLPAGGSIVEYGAGSGQLALILARLGYDVSTVDIDEAALEMIRAQANHLGVTIHTERAEFGGGFEGKTFDCVFFYEAFHHSFEFENLLNQLHDKLNPGGRVVLCGEPVVTAPCGGIPYPWGPRLEALSVYSTHQYGWMELGFTHEFLIEMCRRCGWEAKFYPFTNCGRAEIWVLEPLSQVGESSEDAGGQVLGVTGPVPASPTPDTSDAAPGPSAGNSDEVAALRHQLAMMKSSTSWRVTAPIRALKSGWIALQRARH